MVVGHGEPANMATRKMTCTFNKLFEELAADIYGEVYRRETDGLEESRARISVQCIGSLFSC